MGLEIADSSLDSVEKDLLVFHEKIRQKLRTAQSLLSSKSKDLMEKTSSINEEIEKQLNEQENIKRKAAEQTRKIDVSLKFLHS